MKIGLHSLLGTLSVAVLAAAVAYSLATGTKAGRDCAVSSGAEEAPLIAADDEQARIAELEEALAESRQTHEQEAAAQARRVRALEQRITQLNREIARLNAEQRSQTPVADASTPILRGRPDRDLDQELAVWRLEERLAAGPIDLELSESIERRVVELFSEEAELIGNHLIDTTCGSTFCRVEFQHESKSAESRFLASFANRMDLVEDFEEILRHRIAGDDDLGRKIHSVFFISRQGQDLPVGFE